MSFEHTQAPAGIGIAESEIEQIQKSKLISLGDEIAKAEKRLADLTVTEQDVIVAKKLLADLQQQQASLKTEIIKAGTAHGQLIKDHEFLLDKVKELGDVQAKLASSEASGQAAAEKNSELEQRRDKLLMDIFGLESRQESLVKETELAEKKQEELIAGYVKEGQQIVDVLVEKKSQVESSQKQLDGILVEINKKVLELDGLNKQIVQKTSESDAFKTQGQTQVAALKTQLAETQALKEKEWIDREGSVSKKEAWLVEKTDKLREAKKELEKFYGREIKHVVI